MGFNLFGKIAGIGKKAARETKGFFVGGAPKKAAAKKPAAKKPAAKKTAAKKPAAKKK